MTEAYQEYQLDWLRHPGKRFGLTDLAADIAHDLCPKSCRNEAPDGVHDRRAGLFSRAISLATNPVRVERRRREVPAEPEGVVRRQADDPAAMGHAVAG